MLASDLARAATQAVAATLLIAGVAEIWHLAVLAALYGAAEAFFRPAAGGLIPRLVPDEHLLQANSLIAMSQSLGMVLGPAIAGVLIALFGPGSAIAIDAVSFVVSAGCLALMSPRPGARVDTSGETGAAFLEQLREGWSEVTSRVWLRSFLGVLGAYHLIALPCVLALGPIIADRELDGASSWAVIVTMFGIGSIIGAAIGLRAGPRRPMVACASRSSARPASRRSSPGRAARWRSGRSSCWPASASRSASRCGRRRSAARSRPPRSRASPRSTGSPRSG